MVPRQYGPRLTALPVAMLLAAVTPAAAQSFFDAFRPATAEPAPDDYTEARRAYEEEAAAYWQAVVDKRRLRNAKRRSGETIALDDYVLTQPPLYTGPPRPASPGAPPPPRSEIPLVADFLKAAAEQFGFVPQRPDNELAFKVAYAKAASAAGLTRDQIVRIYAFETGGNGTYAVQAGLTTPQRPGAKAISPAVGYNQLLSTNTIGLLAENGDRFIGLLRQQEAAMAGEARHVMERKIAALRRMVTFARSVPNAWTEHDRLAKTTAAGMGLHAAVLDRDLGPLLQVQKLMDSVKFARAKGYTAPLTAAELELMNLTGDGNGIDMVMMQHAFRDQVPTSNFFQQSGYERNPVARRTKIVTTLIGSIETKMDQASQSRGARDLAASF